MESGYFGREIRFSIPYTAVSWLVSLLRRPAVNVVPSNNTNMLSTFVPLVLAIGVLLRPAWINFGISVGFYIVFTAINNKYGNGIAKYPGPVFAGMTNIWRVRDAYVNGGKRPSYVRLHNQYGDVVRLGPQALSFANPAAIQDIYPADKGMAKVMRSELSLMWAHD